MLRVALVLAIVAVELLLLNWLLPGHEWWQYLVVSIVIPAIDKVADTVANA